MEASQFLMDPLNSASCLPPRKRLLAGLRRQNGCLPHSSSSSSSSSSSLPSSSLSPSLSPSSWSTQSISSVSTEFGVYIHDLLNGNRRLFLSPEEVIEASRSAAVAAAEIAAAAKATALEKAAIAAKAAKAAKNALELVASATDKACIKGAYRKSKPKKQVPVKLLYKGKCLNENSEAGGAKGGSNSVGRINKRKPDVQDMGDVENSFKVPRLDNAQASQGHLDDEELALQLHRAMNSSPRILKKAMNSVLKTADRPNDSDHPRKVLGHKKHKGPKYASLEKVQVNSESQICKGDVTSLCGGHGSDHVETEQSTSYDVVDSVTMGKRFSYDYPTEDCYQQNMERTNLPQVEGEADHLMTDDKQQVDALETGGRGRLIYKHKKLLPNDCAIRNCESQSLDFELAKGRTTEVLQQHEDLEPKALSSVEVSAPHCADRLKPEHDMGNKLLFTPTSSEQRETSSEASAIWNCWKFVFPQSQCVAESKRLCSLHTNSRITMGCSSIKVDE